MCCEHGTDGSRNANVASSRQDFLSVFDPAALLARLPTRAMFYDAVRQGLLLRTGLMRGPLGIHRLPGVLGKALAPDLFLREASVLVCL